jgi:hypothetical protein
MPVKIANSITSILLFFVIAGGVLLLAFWIPGAESGVEQPIQFPHKTHIDLKLVCTGCHQRAEKGAVAGRPPTALCLACHMGGDTKSKEIEKLRAFGKRGQEVPWQRVWRLPSHVYFPHRIHVTRAKIKCQTCHGPMETLTGPPAAPLKKLTMWECIGCHETWKGSEGAEGQAAAGFDVARRRMLKDCTTCHR